MTTPYATLEGHRIVSCSVHVPGIGVWMADIELEGAPTLSGQATLALGELRLTGTIDPNHDGTVALTRRLRLVGGAGGWSTSLAPKSYHNDAGVRAITVAQDAAREAGETLGTCQAADLGIDYIRSAGPASMTLADVAGTAAWWVDLDGVTHVGTRTESEAPRGSYEVLEVVPDQRLITLAADDLRSIGIGSILSERLDSPMTIRAMTIEVEGESVRVVAWCGAPAASHSRAARALLSIVRHTTSERILGGPWKYRVVRHASDRLELQAVVRDAGLPDLGPVSVWPGIAGASAELVPGAEVLIDFIDGDRRQPIVRGFAPKGGAGHVPVSIVLDASGTSASIVLGSGATKRLAFAEDVAATFGEVQATIDGFVPGSGGANFPVLFVAPTAGEIGTSKVRAQ